MEADQLQFPVLPRRIAVDPALLARSLGDRRRQSAPAVLDHRLSAVGADQLFPACRQHCLRVFRYFRGHPQRDPGRSRQGHRDPCLQGLVRRHRRARPWRLGGAIGGVGGDRDRADRDPVPLYRAPSALRMSAGGMVTARRSAWVPHAILIAGLALVLFPIYVAFVASSHALADILEAPMTLLPGSRLVDNFGEALDAGTVKTSGQPVAAMLFNSLVMALAIAGGKIAISLPSAYAVVFFRFPLRRVCFWAIFVTLMLPVEARIIPTYT